LACKNNLDLRDRDASFNEEVIDTVKSFGIQSKRTSFRSPWQNGVGERWVGNCRRDLLDHVIVLNERQLKRLLNVQSTADPEIVLQVFSR